MSKWQRIRLLTLVRSWLPFRLAVLGADVDVELFAVGLSQVVAGLGLPTQKASDSRRASPCPQPGALACRQRGGDPLLERPQCRDVGTGIPSPRQAAEARAHQRA